MQIIEKGNDFSIVNFIFYDWARTRIQSQENVYLRPKNGSGDFKIFEGRNNDILSLLSGS